MAESPVRAIRDENVGEDDIENEYFPYMTSKAPNGESLWDIHEYSLKYSMLGAKISQSVRAE